jgi:hypothetical protein
MIRRTLALLFLAFGAGCVKPPGPAEKASDAARELNITSRYGELSAVIGMTALGVREEFVSRRSEWGKLVRVVDVELAGLTLADRDHASVLVDFSWTRADQGILKVTRVLQEWQDEKGRWQLVREKRVSGDLGLFGEAVASLDTTPRPDVQFETRVIR